MKAMNSKQIVLVVGSILIVSGVIGLINSSPTHAPQAPKSSSANQSTLEVKRANELPTSTIDYIQGSGSLQGQTSQPQSSNAGGQLQAKPDANSLPNGY